MTYQVIKHDEVRIKCTLDEYRCNAFKYELSEALNTDADKVIIEILRNEK